jgi:hypothetical protein
MRAAKLAGFKVRAQAASGGGGVAGRKSQNVLIFPQRLDGRRWFPLDRAHVVSTVRKTVSSKW